MAKYHNKKETKKVGRQIRDLRIKKELTIEDISTMTGFARSTITAIEAGANTDTSHLIEIAKALGEHPMQLFNVSFEIKPRYKRSPNNTNNFLITRRINKLLSESTHFETPTAVKDVVQILYEEYEIKAKSSHVSVVLKRLVEEGKLKFNKHGRNNSYMKIVK